MNNIELIVCYKEDSPQRKKNKNKFIKYWRDWKVTLIEDYNERAPVFNTAARNSTSEYIALADIDAIIPYNQMIPSGDIVYPYSYIVDIDKDGNEEMHWGRYWRYGLMVIFNRKKFLEFGGENEQLKGYGWDDFERYFRARNFGLKQKQIEGPAYHMKHNSQYNKQHEQNANSINNWKIMNEQRMKFELGGLYEQVCN